MGSSVESAWKNSAFHWRIEKSPPRFSRRALRAVSKHVIANQSADWCGNPSSKNSLIQTASGDADCHTSDSGHWFAMTAFFLLMLSERMRPSSGISFCYLIFQSFTWLDFS